ncbi:ribbon-helix-helix domain-containing protein [Lederbergia citrisecunda]|uniref:ribbon-helix-helix domain-containing protein n=1 Tax=Lederbergia citrisecunda TaxID=2833583 RepID=UPI003D269792
MSKIKNVLPESQSYNRLKTRVSMGTTVKVEILKAAKEYSKAEDIPLSRLIDEALLLYLTQQGITIEDQQVPTTE